MDPGIRLRAIGRGGLGSSARGLCGAVVAGVILSSCAPAVEEAPSEPVLPSEKMQGTRLDPVPTYPAGAPFQDPTTFPIGVWLDAVTSTGDLELDKAAGINTYVGLTGDSSPDLVESGGMALLAQAEEWVDQDHQGLDGWLLADELDMKMPAEEAFELLAETESALPKDGRSTYVNYGKGVAFWNSDEEAARFINDFGDIVSVDTYWFTDLNICRQYEGGMLLASGERPLTPEECHRGANYGATVERTVRLDESDGTRKPVWSFVEIGHPSSDDGWPSIQPAEIRSAVWHSIIGGASGVVYFNHSFGGPVVTHDVLRLGSPEGSHYRPIRDVVVSINRQIASLAPVLNSDTVLNFASVEEVKTLTKKGRRAWYVFAGSDGSVGEKTFRIAEGSKVSVVGEQRDIAVRSGVFTDRFDSPNDVHIYRIS